MTKACFQPQFREQSDVVGSNRRGGLRRFWLAHAHMFAPAFGSTDVAHKFLDSLVYRDELTVSAPPSGGLVEASAEVVIGDSSESIAHFVLESPARKISVFNIDGEGVSSFIVAGEIGPGENGIGFRS